MDIDLLSKMVKELIMTSDEVHLPGVGSFVAEIVPASFSDKGFTINPPYRRLYFRHRDNEQGDSTLVDFYAKSNGKDPENVRPVITDFLSEMKDLLEERKMIVMPGLGRLRATKENNFFFVADEDLDIYPGGFGLERISLKSHEETRGEVSAAVASLKEMISAPAEECPAVETAADVSSEEQQVAEQAISISEEQGEPDGETGEVSAEDADVEKLPVEPAPVEEAHAGDVTDEAAEAAGTVEEFPAVEEVSGPEIVEQAAVQEEETPAEKIQAGDTTVRKSPWKTVGKVVLYVLIAIAVLLIAYIAVSHLAPEFIDSILYSPEELEIINYGATAS